MNQFPNIPGDCGPDNGEFANQMSDGDLAKEPRAVDSISNYTKCKNIRPTGMMGRLVPPVTALGGVCGIPIPP